MSELKKELERIEKRLDQEGKVTPGLSPFGTDDDTASRDKRIEACREDFFLFAVTYFPEYFTKPFGKIHRSKVALILSCKIRTLFLEAAPRMVGKTALFRPAFLAWIAIFGKHHHWPWVSDTFDTAASHLEFIRIELKRNSRILHDFGVLINPDWDTYGDFAVYNFQKNSETRFIGLGYGSDVKGKSLYKHYRFDGGTLDDFEPEDEGRNPVLVDKRVQWVRSVLLGSFTREAPIWYNGNNSEPDTAFDKLIKNEDKLKGVVSIVIKAVTVDDTGRRHSCWPEGITVKEWDQVREQVGLSVWLGTYQQEPVTLGKIFKAEYLNLFKWKDLPKDLIIAMRLDPSRGNGVKSDHKAMPILSFSPSMRRYYLLDGFCRVTTVTKMVDGVYAKYFKWVELYHQITIKMEGTFGQKDLLDDFEAARDRHPAPLPLGFYETTENKNSRIMTLEGPFERGDIMIPEDWQNNPDLKVGINMLLAFDNRITNQKDDFPDALSECFRELMKIAIRLHRKVKPVEIVETKSIKGTI